jgi:hypothetical protein
MSPLFATHPVYRKWEHETAWIQQPPISEDENSIWTMFGFNAVVFGHSYHNPFANIPKKGEISEADLHKHYTQHRLPRRIYNIDFGMSRAYNLSQGGWLTVNTDDTITVNAIDQSNNTHSYTYHCKYQEQHAAT